MTVNAGEKSAQGCICRCTGCGERVKVDEGRAVPVCECGNTTFETITGKLEVPGNGREGKKEE